MANIFDRMAMQEEPEKKYKPPSNIFERMARDPDEPPIEPTIEPPIEKPTEQEKPRVSLPDIIKESVKTAAKYATPLGQVEAYKKTEEARQKHIVKPLVKAKQKLISPERTGQALRTAVKATQPVGAFQIAKDVIKTGELPKSKMDKELGKIADEMLISASTDPIILLPMLSSAGKSIVKKNPRFAKLMINKVLRARRLKEIRKIRALRPKVTPIGQVGKPVTPKAIPKGFEDIARELESVGTKINPNGTVTVFHRTTKQGKDLIERTGKMIGKEDGLFFSTLSKGQSAGFGDEIVKMDIPLEKLQLDDIFQNEAHLRLPLKKAGETVDVANYLKPKITPIGQVGKAVTPEVPKAPVSPVDKITSLLEDVKPLRAPQEFIQSAERAKRVARLAALGKKVPGEAGFHAQLGQLKGKLPKLQFESIRKQIKQPDIDSLFNIIEEGKTLTPFDKVTAKSGLAKLLGAEGGALPTRGELSLLSEVFPKRFVQAVLKNRPAMEKLWTGIGEVINLPRAMMATADLSAPLRQGIFFIGRPKQFLPAFKDMFKFASNEKAYRGFMNSIKTRPNYQLMRESKLALTDIGGALTAREEIFMSNLAEKIPIFGRVPRGSNRAYTGFLNKLRVDVFDDLVNSARKLGILEKRPGVVKDIATFVNNATGRGSVGDLGEAAIILNGAFFSPRLAMARLNLLNPVTYMKLDPFVRKEALKSLVTFAGAGASVLGLAKAGGLEVGVNPLSADWGKIKVGNTRYDIWGGFQQFMVALARLAANKMVSSTTGKEIQFGVGYKPINRLDIIKRFFASKASPAASFAMDLLRGRTSIGEKVRVVPNLADRFIPMVAQDFFELYRDYGAKGLAMALPAVFGTGVQTYGEQIPLKAKTLTGREKIEWRQEPTIGETVYNKVTGTIVTTIPKEEQKKLAKERMSETLRKIELAKVKRVVLETGKTQYVGDTKVYLEKGIVKTKKRRKIRTRF